MGHQSAIHVFFTITSIATLTLVGCSNSDDGGGKTSDDGGSTGGKSAGTGGSSSDGGKSAGTGGSSDGGSASDGGTSSGGGDSDGGSTGGKSGSGGKAAGTGGSGAGGTAPGTGGAGNVTPPTLEGDGAAWTWNGADYEVKKNPLSNWYGSGGFIKLRWDSGETPQPKDEISVGGLPATKTGTFACKDILAASPPFQFVWLTWDATATPPNKAFAFVSELPCSITITKADVGNKAGDTFEATFTADLRYPGNGAIAAEDRPGVTGTLRYTHP